MTNPLDNLHDFENSLIGDSNGSNLKNLVSLLRKEEHEVTKVLNRGLSKKDFSEYTDYLSALKCCEEYLTNFWRINNKRV